MISVSVCCVSMCGGLINNGQELGVRPLPVSLSVTAVSGKMTFGRNRRSLICQ